MAGRLEFQSEPGAGAAITGARKAAVFLLSLDEPEAAAVLRRLAPEAVDEVSREIAALGEVPSLVRWRVLRESLSMLRPAAEQRQEEEPGTGGAFEFLAQAGPRRVLELFEQERPEIIALVLAHLPSSRATELLVGLPGQRQIEVVRHVAAMEQTSAEGIEQAQRRLRQRLREMIPREAGAEDVAPEREATDPADHSGQLTMQFDDISMLRDAEIRAILQHTENETLALALKTASAGLRARVFANLSPPAARLLREDMQYIGPVRIEDVEQAQRRIIEAVWRLEQRGIVAHGAESRQGALA